MQGDYLQVANSPILWAAVIPLIALVLFQAILYVRLGYNSSSDVGLTRSDCNKALRVGITSSIGPSLSVFIVMIAMMGIVGTPITWWRLSMIGAANTELTCATFGAEAMGVTFGGPGYGVTEFANSVWAMALNGCGWLVFCGLFTHKLGDLQDKVAGGSATMMQVISIAAVLGTTSYLVTSNTQAPEGGLAPDMLIAAIAAAVFMLIFQKISEKVEWVGEYALGLAMVLGMVIGVIAFNGGVN